MRTIRSCLHWVAQALREVGGAEDGDNGRLYVGLDFQNHSRTKSRKGGTYGSCEMDGLRRASAHFRNS